MYYIMNYKKKYSKYKSKYIILKKIIGGNLNSTLDQPIIKKYQTLNDKLKKKLDTHNIKIISGLLPPGEICKQPCDDNNSSTFIDINNNYKVLLKNIPFLGKKELIKSLTHGNSQEYYQKLIDKHNIIYNTKTIDSIKTIANIFNTKLILLGTSETLAYLGLSLINYAKTNSDKSQDEIAQYISDYSLILSSMENWTEYKNQAIITDTFKDVSDEEKTLGFKDVWGIIDSSIGIILHQDCIVYKNENYYLDFNIAIQRIIVPDPKITTHYCRVTIFEICLIHKIISENPSDYIISFIDLNDIHNTVNNIMVFFINKNRLLSRDF